MDLETGESVRDKETGEMVETAKVNLETGECEISTMSEKQNRKKFRIPNSNPKPKPKSQLQLKHSALMPYDNHSYYSTSDLVPCILFLLPTIFFFYPVIAMCLSIVEIILHIWAHKKNKRRSNKNIYYQSPMHVYVSEFCAACKDERLKNKITNIQDKRNYKFIKYSIDCVQGIAM